MAEEKKDELIHLTIDDIPVAVPPGTLVWAAAQKASIEIPIYCYHPKMPPLGACRMCFVEIEKLPKPPQTACTTPVSEGMIVHTKTEKVLKARRGTLEFLLINHPLDCPICDKGGECDLQDFTLRHGPGGTRFDLYKRHFPKPVPVSDRIMLDRERCILCQRCTRFSSEISMDNGLVMISRGYKMEVGTAPDHAFDSIFSGNTVEICPVGALTAASYRFKARPWELKRIPGVCNNCSVGCNARIDVRVDKIMRLMSRTNDNIDDGWLCDRGRWDFEFVNSSQRLRVPLMRTRRSQKLEPATWDEAYFFIAARLRTIIDRYGAQAVGGIGSTRTTNEEAYLFQKLLRQVIGSPNIDHHHGYFPGPRDALTGKPWMMTNSIAEIEKASHIVLIAADPYQRQPILDLRIKKAMQQGARIYIVNSDRTELDRFAALKIVIPQHSAGAAAKVLLKTTLEHNIQNPHQYDDLRAKLSGEGEHLESSFGLEATTQLQHLAAEIAGARGAIILYDEMATLAPGCQDLASDLQALAVVTGNIDRPGAGVGPLFEDANSLGARDMGLLPDALPGYRAPSETGLPYAEMLSSPEVRALYVMGANPVRHISGAPQEALLQKDFLIVQDIMLTEMAQQADVVLPAVTFAEKEGSMTNIDHHVQAIRRALRPLPGAKADWEILSEIARRLGKPWSYNHPRDVLLEIAHNNPFYAGLTLVGLGLQGVRTQEEEEVARA
jgi:NADH-quinone oxidoreductase subunit G